LPGFVKPLERNMLDMDEPDHARLRTLVHKAFTPALVEGLRERIQEIANHLLDTAQNKGRMDLVRDFALPLPLTVIAELLGIPANDRTKFHRWSKSALRPPSVWNMLRAMPSLWALVRYFRQLFRKLRVWPHDGLLTALVQAEEASDRLTENELLAMAVLLLFAGHETTVNLIASGTLALLETPDQMVWLRENPQRIAPAIEELLRFCNPLEMATTRFAREDVSLGGTTIPRGAMVMAVLASANRDEKQFDEPDRLNLARDNNRHLAFGLGAHFCLGAPLARLEGQIAINALLERMPKLKLAIPVKSLRWRTTPVLRGLESLPVTF
jgi:cytochrome P450 PksS